MPLLLGYWAFGQFWGVWVIMVSYFQAYHRLSDSSMGLLYTVLSTTAVLVMAFLAPRLQGLRLSTSVPVALASLAIGSTVIALQPRSALVAGFILVGLGNGLIDVYTNVAAQRAEIRNRKPVLQWMHACYALGGITGAAVAGLTRTAGLDFKVGMLYSAVALVVTAIVAARMLPRERVGASADTSFSISALFRNPALWIP
ncbi:MAG TPA: hypothetical protein VI589_07295, partial [Vicinamibacteria bacterium]